MNTKIIGSTEKFINKFSENGRVKNELYKKLEANGYKEIRQRKVGSDKFVILASSNKGKVKSNMTLGIDMKKGMVQKETHNVKFMLMYDERLKEIVKIFSDIEGNIKKECSKARTYINGKLCESSINKKFGDGASFKKVLASDKKTLKEVEFKKSNGDFYKFAQKNDGTKVFDKSVNGQGYTFTTSK